MAQVSRRSFTQSVTAAGAATAFTAATSSASAQSANDKVTVALIGCGGRGTGVASEFRQLPNVELAYLCEPDESRQASAAKAFKLPADRIVSDMRKIFDNKSIDAVIVATPDHWHAPAAILACNAGKHVYVEKPCSHNVREGRLLVEAARKNKVVVQHGTQSRSMRIVADAIQMLREGMIGDVLVAKAWNVQRRGNIGKQQPSAAPPGYDLWVGPAPMIPFQGNRYHYHWHWWRHFGTGDIGNDGVHEIDYARWGLGVETQPSKIVGLGGKYFFDDDQEFPDTATVVFEYPGDGSVGKRRQLIFEMRIWSSNYPQNVDNCVEFYGTRGSLLVSKRGKVELRDDKNQLVKNAQPKTPFELKFDHHQRDFVEAIRDGHAPNAEIELGHLSSSLAHLANVAVRTGKSLDFDPVKEQITNDAEANNLLSRSYREGHWAAPQNM
jgi:predicted dehydrogenase